MLDRSQDTTIPLRGGTVGVDVHLMSDADTEAAERTLDCIFGIAVGELNVSGRRGLRAVLDLFGEDGDPSSGSRSYQVAVSDGATCTITLSFASDKTINPNVALAIIARAVIPKVFEHAIDDLIRDDSAPSFAASGYEEILREREAEMMIDGLVASLGNVPGVRVRSAGFGGFPGFGPADD